MLNYYVTILLEVLRLMLSIILLKKINLTKQIIKEEQLKK